MPLPDDDRNKLDARPEAGGVLGDDLLDEVYDAVVERQMGISALRSGIDPHVVADLDVHSKTNEQILSDLRTLDRLAARSGVTEPLRIWLNNGFNLTRAYAEGDVFKRALAHLAELLKNPR